LKEPEYKNIKYDVKFINKIARRMYSLYLLFVKKFKKTTNISNIKIHKKNITILIFNEKKIICNIDNKINVKNKNLEKSFLLL
jgi:hypothetical protein